jgi:hypothetical protein
MYIDSLTITALIVFIGALVLFVNFCLIKVCGLIKGDPTDDDQTHGAHRS